MEEKPGCKSEKSEDGARLSEADFVVAVVVAEPGEDVDAVVVEDEP